MRGCMQQGSRAQQAKWRGVAKQLEPMRGSALYRKKVVTALRSPWSAARDIGVRLLVSLASMSAVELCRCCSKSFGTIPRTILCNFVNSLRSMHSVSENIKRKALSVSGASDRARIFSQALSAAVHRTLSSRKASAFLMRRYLHASIFLWLTPRWRAVTPDSAWTSLGDARPLINRLSSLSISPSMAYRKISASPGTIL